MRRRKGWRRDRATVATVGAVRPEGAHAEFGSQAAIVAIAVGRVAAGLLAAYAVEPSAMHAGGKGDEEHELQCVVLHDGGEDFQFNSNRVTGEPV